MRQNFKIFMVIWCLFLMFSSAYNSQKMNFTIAFICYIVNTICAIFWVYTLINHLNKSK